MQRSRARFDNMPAFGRSLPSSELSNLVAFLQTRKRPVEPDGRPHLTSSQDPSA